MILTPVKKYPILTGEKVHQDGHPKVPHPGGCPRIASIPWKKI